MKATMIKIREGNWASVEIFVPRQFCSQVGEVFFDGEIKPIFAPDIEKVRAAGYRAIAELQQGPYHIGSFATLAAKTTNPRRGSEPVRVVYEDLFPLSRLLS